MPEEELSKPIESFRYVGSIYLKRLQKLGINTLYNLLFHFPHRYDDFTNLKKINEIKIGEVVTIEGKIEKINTRRTFRKRMFLTEALINDNSGLLRVVWFNQPFLNKNLKEGDKVSLAGKVVSSDRGFFLSNPAYEKITEGEILTHTQGLVPVYPETEGLSSRWLRFIIKPLLKKYALKLEEFLPEEILKKKKFPRIIEALKEIHFPKTKEGAQKARERFSFQELFLIQLYLLKQKARLEEQRAPQIFPRKEFIEEFKNNLPFVFTQDQKKAIREILEDLQKNIPMSRLLEGEVGSGKTVIAILISYISARNGFQSVMMAPTEILAKQHFDEFLKLLSNLGINIGLLTRNENKILDKENYTLKNLSKKELIEMISSGKIDILIGTHALIQERIKFKNLALVIVDEQHRFGVEQRAKLCQKIPEEKLLIPHFLSMTATPIPRTLALVLYSDLSISQIKELPKGRKKIITKIISPAARKDIYQFLRNEIKKGRQAFIICPLIEKSEKLESRAAKKEFERLKKKIFPDFKLALLHGKMKTKEKDEAMNRFKEGKVEILVSTPVVEVGIDVPNATLMIIEGAERFGLAQLYQFRGRIGRGVFQSYCFLFTDSPAKRTWQRIKAILSAKDAFELSEKDLKIRGPGDFIGKHQAGMPDLIMASISDISRVLEIKKEAESLLKKDPFLKNYPLLKRKLKEFKEKIFLE